MDFYKEAIRNNVSFPTAKGVLSVTQLFQLSFVDLSNAIKASKKLLKANTDDDLGFLETTPPVVDVEEQIRFEVLKDVFLTKKGEAEALRDAKDKKAHNEKIIALIAEKKEDSLKNLTVEELEALLKQ